MDIDYLLLLQGFREATQDALTPFLEELSLFAVTFLIMVPVFVYWAIDKRRGLYVLASYYLCCGVNALVKLTACVYRPWIRDARIHPAGDAIATATGYSFPSGHTVTAGPIYGGLALTWWKRNRAFSIICLALLLLTAFSRNYLGVHTPQDVFVGLCESALALFAVSRILTYLDEHPEKENLFLLASFIVGWLGIAYVTFKPYPMDYVNGQLLVDPQKMMDDGYGDTCLLIAFPVARYLEKTWVKFTATGLKGPRLALAVLGLVPMFFMIRYLRPSFDALLGSHWGHFANSFVLVAYSIVLWPLAIKWLSEKVPLFRAEEEASVTDAG